MNGAEKNAIVTGVSSGIGNHLVKFLLQQGWSVSGLSRRPTDISDPRFAWYQCDLSDAQAVARVAQQLGKPIDVVVHNAAVSGGVGAALDLEVTAWRAAFEVNFFAPLSLTKHLVARCSPNACVVVVSGGGAVTPRPLVGPYAISKLALVKLAEQLALDHPRLRFYALAPGVHLTKLFEEQRQPGSTPAFADLSDVERLLQTLIADTDGRLNGKLVHIRDDIEKLLSVPEGGLVRRVERR